MFSYRPGGNYIDDYGQYWTLSGDPDLVDISITNNRIKYGRYPGIFARLYGSMNSHEGRYFVISGKTGI